MNKHKTIPIFVSHMGCPNDCSFCNQRKITGHNEIVTPEIAEKIIRQSLKTIPKSATIEIGYFGGSFTGIEKNLQKELLEVAYKFVVNGDVDSIRLSTRPDYIDEDIVSMIKSYGVSTVELGAQSMDNTVLKLNRRGHTAEDTVRASKTILSKGLNLGLQMMTGLFGDTNITCMESAKKIISLGPTCVRIYPTLVLKDTYLAELYNNREYRPQDLQEAVTFCSDLKQMFDKAGISVIRMGLMSSDNINPENDVLAGPYHSSFGELVQSEIYLRMMTEQIKSDCFVAVNPKSISAFVGNKKRNIKKIKEQGYNITFVQDESILPGEFKLIN